MRSLSTTTTFIIAAVLALLLIGFVFAGGGQDTTRSKTHCSAPEAYEQIRDELFRRAAATHPAKAGVLRQVANYSLVRRNSQVRRRSGDSGTVQCAGSIALELPPGVAVIGGRRSLAANVSYSLARQSDGRLHLLSLSNTDAIVVPLGALVDARTQQQGPAMPVSDDQALSEAAPPPPPPAPPAPPRPLAQPEQGRIAPPAPRPVKPVVRPAAKSAAQAPTQRSSSSASRPAGSSATGNRATAATPATTNPSFNCRYARTRGEIAVCRDPGLASLDRQMAGQFNRAMSAASPGARLILQRSRNRFLKYRDSCGSEACIAEAYHGRMREISDIATRY
jgi:hypothetical protein